MGAIDSDRVAPWDVHRAEVAQIGVRVGAIPWSERSADHTAVDDLARGCRYHPEGRAEFVTRRQDNGLFRLVRHVSNLIEPHERRLH
jgi:hypothetical protein